MATGLAPLLNHVGQLMSEKSPPTITIRLVLSMPEIDVPSHREGARIQILAQFIGRVIGVDDDIIETVTQLRFEEVADMLDDGAAGAPCCLESGLWHGLRRHATADVFGSDGLVGPASGSLSPLGDRHRHIVVTMIQRADRRTHPCAVPSFGGLLSRHHVARDRIGFLLGSISRFADSEAVVRFGLLQDAGDPSVANGLLQSPHSAGTFFRAEPT